MASYDDRTLSKLLDGDLPSDQLQEILSGQKDPGRFEQVRRLLQSRVDWDAEILLPIEDNLYVVATGGDRVVKCECGHEFGDYRENWKHGARVRVRDTDDELEELYPKDMTADPEWTELREYFCPDCYTLLDVEGVPPGYPPVFNFLPDIDAFYNEWLDRPVPGENDG